MDFKTIATDLGFLEGPVALQDGSIAVTSINTGRVLLIEDPHGEATCTTLAAIGGGPNGATEGVGGEILIAQNGGKPPSTRSEEVNTGGIQAVARDGSVRWISRDPISPNDICVGPEGFIYVTDPTRPRTRADGRLWRCAPDSSESELLASLPWYPNGLGFGIEDDALYVASTDEQRIVRFPIDAGTLGRPETYIQMTKNGPDGFAFDAVGNLIIGAVGLSGGPGDIQIWSPEGELLEVIEPGSDTFYTNMAILTDGSMVVTSSGAGQVLLTAKGLFEPLALHPFR